MVNVLVILQLLLIVLAFAWIGAGIISVIWFVIRAACRKVGLAGRYLIFVPGAVVAVPVLLLLAARIDRLDALERTCRTASLANAARLQDAANVRVQEHYDFWNETYSGSAAYPWLSRRYETPKVSLLLNFEVDQRPYSSWVHCDFSKIPNTGKPAQLDLQNVHVVEGGEGPFVPN
jgi:hypothetical protein